VVSFGTSFVPVVVVVVDAGVIVAGDISVIKFLSSPSNVWVVGYYYYYYYHHVHSFLVGTK
jgi:hypothetical protein